MPFNLITGRLTVLAHFGGAIVHAFFLVPQYRLIAAEPAVALAERVSHGLKLCPNFAAEATLEVNNTAIGHDVTRRL